MAVALVAATIIRFYNKAKAGNPVLDWILGITGLIMLALGTAVFLRLPYARFYKKNEGNVCTGRSVQVNLAWEKRGRKGLLLPRFRVVNGEIFPACFMDAGGTPIRTAFCIALTEIVWSDNYHCTCKARLVLDDTPEDKLFQPGNRFYLYYNYRKIAMGSISSFHTTENRLSVPDN